MASVFPILFVIVVVAALMTCVALFTPKGPQQVIIRTVLMISLAGCCLLWTVTYLAQLHPLIAPIRTIKTAA